MDSPNCFSEYMQWHGYDFLRKKNGGGYCLSLFIESRIICTHTTTKRGEKAWAFSPEEPILVDIHLSQALRTKVQSINCKARG